MMGTESKKQNILIVHNYYQIPGGEDTVVANEKRMLEEHGHKVILYTRNNAELKRMSKLRKLFLPMTTVFNPKSYKKIKQFISAQIFCGKCSCNSCNNSPALINYNLGLHVISKIYAAGFIQCFS